ncbi:MAG: hypothetical protein WC736_15480 [Gallionella sp.]
MTVRVKEKRKYMASRAKGETITQSARDAGVARITAYRWETAEDVRESIDQLTKQYVSKLPEAIKLSHDLVDAGNTLDKIPENGKILELAAKEGARIQQSVGIAPTQTAPQAIINIMNIDARQVHVSGTVGELLRKHFTLDADSSINPPVIDITDPDEAAIDNECR